MREYYFLLHGATPLDEDFSPKKISSKSRKPGRITQARPELYHDRIDVPNPTPKEL
jgi:hypothetical protein